MAKKSVQRKLLACALVGALACSTSCYGPFNLTRQVHHFNGQVGGKWVNELVFLGLIILPVYSLATLGDGLIFNSIEFWLGENPIGPPEGSGDGGSASAPTPDEEVYTVLPDRTPVPET